MSCTNRDRRLDCFDRLGGLRGSRLTGTAECRASTAAWWEEAHVSFVYVRGGFWGYKQSLVGRGDAPAAGGDVLRWLGCPVCAFVGEPAVAVLKLGGHWHSGMEVLPGKLTGSSGSVHVGTALIVVLLGAKPLADGPGQPSQRTHVLGSDRIVGRSGW